MKHANQTSSYNYDNERDAVIDRDQGCVLCGNEEANTVHHIIPRSEFGYDGSEHLMSNMVLVCNTPCHWDLERESVTDQVEMIEDRDGGTDETLSDIYQNPSLDPTCGN